MFFKVLIFLFFLTCLIIILFLIILNANKDFKFSS